MLRCCFERELGLGLMIRAPRVIRVRAKSGNMWVNTVWMTYLSLW